MLGTETQRKYLLVGCPGVTGHQGFPTNNRHWIAEGLLIFESLVLLSGLVELFVNIDEAGSQAMEFFILFVLDLLDFLQLFPIEEV